jgi:cytochrome c-type biogenesis protein CcmH
VQRRLLAAAEAVEPAVAASSRGPVLTVLLLVPIAAFALYIVGGSPEMPAAPLAERVAEQQKRSREADRLIGQLRERLTQISPQSPQYRQGYVLLGNAEASRGNLGSAADAWRTALNTGFDPTLAVETAEAITEASGHVTDEAAALFRRALSESPNDAPWRPMAEKRLAEIKPPP